MSVMHWEGVWTKQVWLASELCGHESIGCGGGGRVRQWPQAQNSIASTSKKVKGLGDGSVGKRALVTQA